MYPYVFETLPPMSNVSRSREPEIITPQVFAKALADA